jgi:hypothetical protein
MAAHENSDELRYAAMSEWRDGTARRVSRETAGLAPTQWLHASHGSARAIGRKWASGRRVESCKAVSAEAWGFRKRPFNERRSVDSNRWRSDECPSQPGS